MSIIGNINGNAKTTLIAFTRKMKSNLKTIKINGQNIDSIMNFFGTSMNLK